MPRKISSAKIYRERRDNYVFHFEQRAIFKALPLELQLLYQKWRATLPAPRLNPWGAGVYSEDEWTRIIQLAIAKGLPDAFYLVSWYQSDDDWNVFQELWQNLPDVLHFSPQEPLWMIGYNYEDVHIPAAEKETRVKLYTGGR
jgi:hypothetical protein